MESVKLLERFQYFEKVGRCGIRDLTKQEVLQLMDMAMDKGILYQATEHFLFNMGKL
jgi:hypothetical protein